LSSVIVGSFYLPDTPMHDVDDVVGLLTSPLLICCSVADRSGMPRLGGIAMNRTTRAIGFTTAAFTAAFVGSSLPVAVGDSLPMQVSSVAAPLWLSNSSMSVAFTATNKSSSIGCAPMKVTLSWKSSGDVVHHRSVTEGPLSGLHTGVLTIPGSTIWPGTLRYRVTAKQDCEMFGNTPQDSVGQFPATGWSKTTIK
jgi:hypothetical protein